MKIAGVENSRREKEIARLNSRYAEVIAEKTDLQSCVSFLVNTESYRFLSGWTYSLVPECLRLGSRAFEMPDHTDVIIF